eukprot:gb/GFBE01064592.1/.p1 GENE.gb/GFBE01064592.1/~~gb/GFBE01064592.1/.p1  ORF type:complete len:535 (+),score=107.27 gb/GFBE01064592.1/:1-1605(+)
MIHYEDGLRTLFMLKGSVIPKAFFLSLPSVILTVVLLFIEQGTGDAVEEMYLADMNKSQVWSAMTMTLATLIGFRTRQSLGRFWEGTSLLHQMRGEWFDAVSCLFSFSRKARDSKPVEVTQFRQCLVRLTSLMHGAAMDEITSDSGNTFEIIDVCALDSTTLTYLRDCSTIYEWNRVCIMQHMIQVLVCHNHHIGVLDIPPPILSRCFQTLSRGLVNLLNAVKIKDTCFPFPWAQIICWMLGIHAIFTPLIVTSMMKSFYWAIPVTFIPVFGMIALNLVATQLEMPFGLDDNDLPLAHFQTEMNMSLLLLMHENADHLPTIRPSAITDVDELRMSWSSTQEVLQEHSPGSPRMTSKERRRESHSKVMEDSNFTLTLQELDELDKEYELTVPPEMKREEKQAQPVAVQKAVPEKEKTDKGMVLPPVSAANQAAAAAAVATPTGPVDLDMQAHFLHFAHQHVEEIRKNTEALQRLATLPESLAQHAEVLQKFMDEMPRLLASCQGAAAQEPTGSLKRQGSNGSLLPRIARPIERDD